VAILKADDGTLLKAKEGVVLNDQGRPLTESPFQFNKPSGFKIISTGNLSLPMIVLGLVGLGIFIPLLITAGVALAAIVGVLFTLTVVNQKLGRLFRKPL
jgi:hypothetical protein